MKNDKGTILDMFIGSSEWGENIDPEMVNKASEEFYQEIEGLPREQYGKLEVAHNTATARVEKIAFMNGFNEAVKLLMNCMK